MVQKKVITYENYKVFIHIQLENISIIKTSVHFLDTNFQIISLEFHFNSLKKKNVNNYIFKTKYSTSKS